MGFINTSIWATLLVNLQQNFGRFNDVSVESATTRQIFMVIVTFTIAALISLARITSPSRYRMLVRHLLMTRSNGRTTRSWPPHSKFIFLEHTIKTMNLKSKTSAHRNALVIYFSPSLKPELRILAIQLIAPRCPNTPGASQRNASISFPTSR